MKKWIIPSLILAALSCWAWAAQPVNLYDAAGNAITSTGGALNISGTINAANPSIGAIPSPVPTNATYIGANKNGILSGAVKGSTTSADALAVVLPTDQVQIPVMLSSPLPVGANVIGAVTQSAGPWSMNHTQINGTAVLAGAGNTGTGSQRVTIASDQAQIPTMLSSPLPTGANVIGAVTQSAGPWTQNLTQVNSTALLAGAGNTGTGSPRVTIASDQAQIPVMLSSPLPVGANVIGAVTQSAGPWSFNHTQINGTAVLAGAGNTGTGSQRVTIASDQAQIPVMISSPLPTGANVIGAVTQSAGPWSQNLTQVNGTALLAGAGNTGAGSPRVTIASDQAQIPVMLASPLPAGASTIGAVTQASGPWTQNLTQVNSTTLLAGNGVTGTGSPRVTIASDNTAIPMKAPVNTTGSGSVGASTVSTVVTITAPSNTVGFILMNLDTSTANLRWSVGRTATTTSGQQLQPGRDTGFVPNGANLSVVSESGTQNYDVQWFSQ